MQRRNRVVEFTKICVVGGLCWLLSMSAGQSVPAAAQGPQPLSGKPVEPTSSAVIDFGALAREEAALPAESRAAVGSPVPFMRDPAPLQSEAGSQAPAASAPAQSQAASPAPSLTFQGLDDIARVGSGFFNIPPDTDGAVGPARVITTLNNNYRVLEKATGATVSTVSMESFWKGTGATDLFDPKTLYDPYNNRFVAVGMANAETITSSIVYGVSDSSDPNGTWKLFRFVAAAQIGGVASWADYPGVGFNKNWLAISANMFGNADGLWKESRLLIVNYPSLLAGTPSAQLVTGIQSFSLQPALTYDAAQGTLYVTSFSGLDVSGNGYYRLSTISGTPAAPVFTRGNQMQIMLSPFSMPNGNQLPQANGTAGGDTAKIDAGDSRILNTVFRNNQVWFAHTVGLPVGTLSHTAAEWARLNTDGSWSDGGRIEDTSATATNGGKWYAYPSISVNKNGDALVGFSQFGSNQFPSAGYAVRASGDAPGTMRDPLIYKNGAGFYWKNFFCPSTTANNRWGDYSATQVDPDDDRTFWTIQEFSKPEGALSPSFPSTGCDSGVWNTWWAKVALTTGPMKFLYLPLVVKNSP